MEPLMDRAAFFAFEFERLGKVYPPIGHVLAIPAAPGKQDAQTASRLRRMLLAECHNGMGGGGTVTGIEGAQFYYRINSQCSTDAAESAREAFEEIAEKAAAGLPIKQLPNNRKLRGGGIITQSSQPGGSSSVSNSSSFADASDWLEHLYATYSGERREIAFEAAGQSVRFNVTYLSPDLFGISATAARLIAAEIAAAGAPPTDAASIAPEKTRRLTVDVETRSAALDGKHYDLPSEQCARWLDVLVKNPGKWISGPDMKLHDPLLQGVRTNRMRAMLPQQIHRLVKTSKRDGARLVLA